MQDVWISVKSIKNHANRHYGFTPYVAVCCFWHGYIIPQGTWGSLDFPYENFFSDNVDEAIMNWKPTGAEPKMTDASVQSRAGANLGQKSIVVPPALEEK